MLSLDIRSLYRHLRLSPSMREMLIFRYGGRFYRCVALLFDWVRSPMWFTSIMAPVVQEMSWRYGFRVLSYLDIFLVVRSAVGHW